MSTTSPTTSRPGRGGAKITKAVAAVAVIAALLFGANAISKNGSSSTTTNATTPTAPAAVGGGPHQMGAAVTGTTLTKLEQAATAKYPGTVERAMQLPDGSYEVHVILSNGTEVHVLVSTDFKVTGTQQDGPPAGAAPPSGSTSSSAS